MTAVQSYLVKGGEVVVECLDDLPEALPVVEVLLVDLAQLLHPLPQRHRSVLQVRHRRQPTLESK